MREAMKLVATEGMIPGLKTERIKKQIDRDARRYHWTEDSFYSLDSEWQWRICCAKLQLGDLDWKGWEWREPRAGYDPFEYPKWKGEKVKRLLVYGEQGLGDEVMFAQVIPKVFPYAEEVVIECEPRLAAIFRDSFGCKVHGRKDLRDTSWIDEPFDAKVIFGDLCKRFLRTPADFVSGPYLKASKADKWTKYKGYTAISWKGRQGLLDPEKFRGEKVVSLQYDGDHPDWCDVPDIDLREDIEDVFGILANVDRLICVPTSALHMAGAIGTPVDLILTPGKTGEPGVHNGINWRFGMGREMRWHDSVTVYRNWNDYAHRKP